MSKLALASLSGLGGAAGIGGGIYLLNKDSKSPVATKEASETIQSKLQKEKFKILDIGASEWGEIKDKYNSLKSDASKVFNVSSDELNEHALKDLCKEHLNKSEFDDALYSKVKRWCVTPVTVSSHLSNWGLTSLSTDSSNNNNQKELTALAKKYATADNKIKGVDTLESEQWRSLQTKCKDIGGKKNYDDDFDSLFESSKTWCTTEGFNALPKENK
ncbi:hypothetical protein HF1_08220 [Mycoplasma haemofelis str. Langford 1]|uniref:Uncharacterized protein n=2 Tax=Mycoplasma haemofelis TaxID=29501 RepID=F6FIW1_MYCHI|nr:hypothetical protein [Mycoplasma haemofelis]AEG73159.1 hypothetical protein MHF_0901 [Mycoplasma haemofelis Ohio2]CBY92830.1 hypothetical protein HF1_08220 [Mycoplasma haemofelis str. Langford 1]